MTISGRSTALSKFTVLDLTRVRSGPTAVRQLADWGADVIMVEMPESVDRDGALGGDRDGPDFVNLHRNKRSITLNLKKPEGVELLKKLVKSTDVLVENYRPDVKQRLGIDYETLSEINPRLVYASISGFGQEGPYAPRPGFDQVAQGMGGMMSINGLPGDGPVRVGIPIADLAAGLFCALGILTALLERETSERGQWVQSSLLQSQIFLLDFQTARWLMEGDVPKQAGNHHPTTIPTGLFKTADGHINLSVFGEQMWKKFCIALGKPELVSKAEYNTPNRRSKNRDALNALIGDVIRGDTSEAWIKCLNEAGVPAGPVYRIDEMFADEQVQFLSIVEKLNTQNHESVKLVGQPMTLSRTPSRLVIGPPLRGQHNREIYENLGLSDASIKSLEANSII